METQTDDVSKTILQIRKLDKIRNTFIKNMILDKAKDGRIYCSFNPMGTVTGRFSSQYPNLQQVPARDPELGPMIRSLFLPEDNHDWVACDYAQQEPRVLVHYASLKLMDSAMAMQKEYLNNPKTDFHSMVATMASIPRKQAKTINLGLFYGMGTICIVILLCIVGSYFRARRPAREIAEVEQRRTLRDNESASIIKQRKIQLERKVITMVSIIILFSFF